MSGVRRLAALPLVVGGCLYQGNPAYDDTGAEVGSVGTSTSTSTTTQPATTQGSVSTEGTTSTTTSDCVGGPADWWDTNWDYRRPVAFDTAGLDGELVDATILVALEPGAPDDSKLAVEGADVRFVGEDGEELAFHFDAYAQEQTKHAWVRVPSVSPGPTQTAWLYYGRPDAADGQDAQGAYDDDTAGVWHLSEPTGLHLDPATGVSCTWLGGGGGTQDAPGRVGRANEFDGAQDAVTCSEDHVGDTEFSTITAWVQLDLVGNNHQRIVSVESTGNPTRGLGLSVRRSDGAIGTRVTGFAYAAAPENMVVAGQWAFIAMRTRKSDTDGFVEVSKDAGPWEMIASGDTGMLGIDANTPLVLGKWPGPGPGTTATGIIDEVTVSMSLRSDDWVRAQYRSALGTMGTLGDEQSRCP